MSCLKKESTGVYYLYWYCIPGDCEKHDKPKQHGKSLHVSDGKTASSIQKDFDIAQKEIRRHVTMGQPIPKAQADLTLAQWQVTYLAYKQGKMKETSLQTAGYAIQHLARYLGSERKLRLIDRGDMEKYWRFCMDVCKLATGTLSSRRAMLASSFADAVKMEYMTMNPMQFVERVRMGKTKKEALDRVRLREVLSVADKPWSTLLRAAYLTGGRISELCKLKRRWVNRQESQFTFVDPKEKDDKTLHLYDELRECFDEAERYSGPGEYVFTYGGQPINRNKAYKHIREIGESVGIGLDAKGKPQKPYLGPHMLRRSRITHLLQDGVPLIDVMGIVGHRNISTTQVYTSTNAKRQKEIEGRLSLRSALAAI